MSVALTDGGNTAALVRPCAGLCTVLVIVAVVGLAAASFQGRLSASVPLTVLSPRAGLVMNPDAKVMFHDVQVGQVESIETMSDGRASLRLAMNPESLSAIPSNAKVDIASTTVFGAKSVQLEMPPSPSPDSMRTGQVLEAHQVMVEINTLFERLVSVLSAIHPEKLNETLGAIAAATNGNGEQVGEALADLNSLLAQVNPRLGALGEDLRLAPEVVTAYADAAPNLVDILSDTTEISRTVVDQADSLDATLLGVAGLARVGNEFLAENRRGLTDALGLLVPTTELTNEYSDALRCGLTGASRLATNPPLAKPGINILAGLLWGQERYRYPSNLPRVAAKGGPQCSDLPVVPFEQVPPFVVTDIGANPWKNTNPGIVLNSNRLKEILFGPLDGPPRNSAQIGQPG